MKVLGCCAVAVLILVPSSGASAQGSPAIAVDSVNTRMTARTKGKPAASATKSAAIPEALARTLARTKVPDSTAASAERKTAPPAPKRAATAKKKG